MENKPIAFIRVLLKDKSEKEIFEAEENWREYMLVVKEIADKWKERITLKSLMIVVMKVNIAILAIRCT